MGLEVKPWWRCVSLGLDVTVEGLSVDCDNTAPPSPPPATSTTPVPNWIFFVRSKEFLQVWY